MVAVLSYNNCGQTFPYLTSLLDAVQRYIHDINVRTLPLMVALQIGQLVMAGAHSVQHTRWPQGKNTTLDSLSMQILHIISWRSIRFSSSKLWFSVNRISKHWFILRYYLNTRNGKIFFYFLKALIKLSGKFSYNTTIKLCWIKDDGITKVWQDVNYQWG